MTTSCWSANSKSLVRLVQADLALHWWQRLVTFAASRLRVKANDGKQECLLQGILSSFLSN